MYLRRGRFSFYIGHAAAWLRFRDRDGMPNGFLLRIGREAGE